MLRRQAFMAVIGGVVGAVLVMAAGQFFPRVTRIICTSLEVVDSKGNPRVQLSASEEGGRVQVLGDVMDATMIAQGHMAIVLITGEDSEASMSIIGEDEDVVVGVSGGGIPPRPSVDIDEHGRRVVVYPKDDKPEARMGIGKHGGYVHVSGGNEDYRSKAMMYIGPYGGEISTRDKNGDRLATLK